MSLNLKGFAISIEVFQVFNAIHYVKEFQVVAVFQGPLVSVVFDVMTGH